MDDRIYTVREFDRTLVIDGRTKAVAEKITAFLRESGDRFQKAIIFCVDQEHAARMRQALVNENADLVEGNARYVMRITGEDETGKNELGNFIDPESKYPVLVTTSRLLSTGVDVQTCRLIVLDRAVGSMTEFKQIVGRGTRVHEDTGKFYFTLIDFRGATGHFADPEFDGEPVQIYEPGDQTIQSLPPDPPPPGPDGPDDGEIIDRRMGSATGHHRAGVAERRSTSTASKRPSSPSAWSTSTGVASSSPSRYATLRGRSLRRRFASLGRLPEPLECRRSASQAIIDGMTAEGLPLAVIVEELGKDLDPFDLVCHVAFDAKPLTRRERAESVKKRDVFTRVRVVRPAPCWPRYSTSTPTMAYSISATPRCSGSHLSTASARRSNLFAPSVGKPGFERAVHDLQSELYRESA